MADAPYATKAQVREDMDVLDALPADTIPEGTHLRLSNMLMNEYNVLDRKEHRRARALARLEAQRSEAEREARVAEEQAVAARARANELANRDPEAWADVLAGWTPQGWGQEREVAGGNNRRFQFRPPSAEETEALPTGVVRGPHPTQRISIRPARNPEVVQDALWRLSEHPAFRHGGDGRARVAPTAETLDEQVAREEDSEVPDLVVDDYSIRRNNILTGRVDRDNHPVDVDTDEEADERIRRELGTLPTTFVQLMGRNMNPVPDGTPPVAAANYMHVLRQHGAQAFDVAPIFFQDVQELEAYAAEAFPQD